jgi:acetyl esterase/lipase
MATDPAFTVEWTVPTEDDGWGDGAPTARRRPPSSDTDAASITTSSEPDRERLSGRDPANLPPAPVLAARVDYLRSDRDAAERRVEAVRERYETVLADRNAEIRELRSQESVLARARRWVTGLF